MATIRFCENNFTQGTEEVVEKLRRNFKEENIEVESCLGYCSDCAVGPYALVEDEFIQADSPDELYEAIVEIIRQD